MGLVVENFRFSFFIAGHTWERYEIVEAGNGVPLMQRWVERIGEEFIRMVYRLLQQAMQVCLVP